MKIGNKSLIVIFSFLLCLQFTGKIVRQSHTRIVDDVCYVLNPAKVLVEKGSLADSGYALQMQLLRDSPEDSEKITMPYWFSCLGPVLYFAPFIKIFGHGTNTPFLVGQSVLLLTIVLLLLHYGKQCQGTLETLILINLFLASCLDLSLIYAATPLLFIPLMIIVWFNRKEVTTRPLLLGLLLGLGYQVRPEALALLGGLFIYSFLLRESYGKFIKQNAILWITFIAIHVLFYLLRSGLGGAPSTDHFLIGIGTAVLGNDGFVIGGKNLPFLGPKIFTIHDLLTPQAIKGVLAKVSFNFYHLLAFDHTIFKMSLFSFMVVLFFVAILLFKRLTRDDRLDWVFIAISAFLMFVLASMSNSTPRYYEVMFSLVFFFLLEHLKIYKSLVSKDVGINKNLLAYAIFLILFTYTSIGIFRITVRRPNSDADYIKAAGEVKKYVKSNERVMIRYPELWNWYCDGDQSVVFDNSPDIDDNLYSLYQPHAIILRAVKGSDPVQRIKDKGLKGRIALDGSYDVLVYR